MIIVEILKWVASMADMKHIKKRYKLIGVLLLLFTLNIIPIIFFSLTLRFDWALIFYAIAIVIFILVWIVEPVKFWKEEIPSHYLKKAKIIRGLFTGGIILVVLSSYLLLFVVIFISNELVVLLIANILIYVLICGVIVFSVSTYMYIKFNWKKDLNS